MREGTPTANADTGQDNADQRSDRPNKQNDLPVGMFCNASDTEARQRAADIGECVQHAGDDRNTAVFQKIRRNAADQQKIDALYNWVLRNDMVYYRTYEHVKADWVWKASWVDDMATSQMDRWGGNCYRYASFLGMLIREATGLEVRVYQGKTPAAGGGLTYHGWPAVNQDGTWYIYDVELQKHSGYASYLCYKVPAKKSSSHFYGEPVALY